MSIGVRPSADQVRTVAVIGTGVIGGGWAAHFLRMGYDVVAWDPAPEAEARLTRLLDTAWPALERLGLRSGAGRGRLTFADTLSDALLEADFVQESSPEVLEAKIALLAAIDAGTRPGVVVGSSTSGFGMSAMASRCATPGRFVVGHPFNPPYLIPLVEVVGGERTEPEVVSWATEFYTHAGKVTLTLDDEVPGFVGNRLQEALWREALHMVESGQATVKQTDDSITYGPGLRWALMGPILTFHLAGGPGGMAHMLDQFGPALQEPWTRLDAPELTSALRDTVVAGAQEQAGGSTVADLERQRDAFLVDLLLLLERHRRPTLACSPPQTPEPFSTYRTEVREEWLDYNGHMHDASYAIALSEANEELFAALDLSEDYRRSFGASYYTVECQIRYLAECSQGQELRAATTMVAADARRVRLFTELLDQDGAAVATGEHLYLHVDATLGKVTEVAPERLLRLEQMRSAHAGLDGADRRSA